MTYLGIDRDRFAYLLHYGTQDFELKKFFNESRRPLILQGARVQNLPPTPRARVKALTADLPATADPVIRGWFAKNVTIVDLASPDDLVRAFKAAEESRGDLAQEEARVYARSCLVHLFGDHPDEAMLRFLRTPLRVQPTNDEPTSTTALITEPSSSDVPRDLPLLLQTLVEGKEIQEHLDGLRPAVASFALGLHAARAGRPDEVREALEALSAEPILRRRLEQFIQDQATRSPSAGKARRGFELVEVGPFDGTLEVETDWVLGCCTYDLKFVRLLAVVRAGLTGLLTKEQSEALFPESGDAMAFNKPGLPKPPRQGEFGIWQVAEHEALGKTHFHLTKRRPVYEVRAVPFSSTENDAVRDFLKEQARTQSHQPSRFRQPTLFLMDDGLVVGGLGEYPDYARDETFEAGLVFWTSLPAIRFEGRLLSFGPLPKESGAYECGSLASAVRKIFKSPSLVDRGFSKAQIQKLAQSLDAFDPGAEGLRLTRVRSALHGLAHHADALEAVVAEIMTQPDVAARVDQGVENAVAQRVAEKQGIQAEIERLRRERGDVEQRLAKQKAEHQALRDETSKVLKEAFERARTKGVATFAEMAVFQALTAPAVSVQDAPQTQAQQVPRFRTLTPTEVDAEAVFSSAGVTRRRAAAFAALGNAAIKAGLLVFVRGLAARHVVQAWVAGAGQLPGLFDAGVGLIDDEPVRAALNRTPTYDAIALLDGNLSALDLYAKPLFDLAFARLLQEGGKKTPWLLVSLNDGVGSLPIPVNFERISVCIDTDSTALIADEARLDALEARAFEGEEATIAGLWPPAAARLRTQLDALDGEVKAMALSALLTR